MYRPMDLNDISDIVRIEQSVYSTPWTRKEIREHLEHGIGTVRIERRSIVAYALYMQDRSRFILQRLVVRPDQRRKGYGSDLLLSISDGRRLVTYIPEEDLDAQQFMRACCHRCVRIKPKFFDGSRNAYVFNNRQEAMSGRKAKGS